jgi:hypothetical protein
MVSSRDRSVADEPVNGEPVSASQLPANREFLLLINKQIQMLAAKFPSKWNREFFLTEQGILAPE